MTFWCTGEARLEAASGSGRDALDDQAADSAGGQRAAAVGDAVATTTHVRVVSESALDAPQAPADTSGMTSDALGRSLCRARDAASSGRPIR
jgi:hypothetical protein